MTKLSKKEWDDERKRQTLAVARNGFGADAIACLVRKRDYKLLRSKKKQRRAREKREREAANVSSVQVSAIQVEKQKTKSSQVDDVVSVDKPKEPIPVDGYEMNVVDWFYEKGKVSSRFGNRGVRITGPFEFGRTLSVRVEGCIPSFVPYNIVFGENAEQLARIAIGHRIFANRMEYRDGFENDREWLDSVEVAFRAMLNFRFLGSEKEYSESFPEVKHPSIMRRRTILETYVCLENAGHKDGNWFNFLTRLIVRAGDKGFNQVGSIMYKIVSTIYKRCKVDVLYNTEEIERHIEKGDGYQYDQPIREFCQDNMAYEATCYAYSHISFDDVPEKKMRVETDFDGDVFRGCRVEDWKAARILASKQFDDDGRYIDEHGNTTCDW